MNKYLGPGKIGEWGILPYSDLFIIGSRQHDLGYSKGGNSKDKQKADEWFYRLMLAKSKTKTQKTFAKIYFKLVNSLGNLYFKQ